MTVSLNRSSEAATLRPIPDDAVAVGCVDHFGGLLEEDEDEADEERRDRGRVDPADLDASRSPGTVREEGSVSALSDLARTAGLRWKRDVGERRASFVSVTEPSESESYLSLGHLGPTLWEAARRGEGRRWWWFGLSLGESRE